MPQIQPVVFPALSVGLIKAMASPCKLCLPLICALFFGHWFLISKQKARALPSLQQHKAEFKAVGSFGGEGKSETVFGEGGADSRNGHQVSSMPLSSMHEQRFVTVTCPSVVTGCLFPQALLSFCHLLPGFLLLSTVCEVPGELNCPWSPSHKIVPQGVGGQRRRLLLCSIHGCSHAEG